MKKFNISEFIWFFILLMFTLYIYFLLYTGKITLFIHPKLVKYSVFSFIVLGELTIVQLFKIFTVKTRITRKNGYALFLLALIFGVFFAPGGLTSDIGDKKGVILVSSEDVENIGRHSHSEEQVIEGNDIVFTEKNYIHYLEDLSANLDKHMGKKIKITGFVLKNDKLQKDEFILTRMLINCCAADSQVMGVTVKYDKAITLNKDEWVNVEGIVSSKGKQPIILVQKITKVNKPSNPYIYE
ncbi:TIGR03943 family protein [Clostridiales bacterium oral taxon 876 str. F0540]|nr:TIGR03943 family protein [Clostridiales bacterium oral taxon 876 str. F0540]